MYQNDKPLLVSIVGPTAVGKTSLAISVAAHFKTEVISADSRQFYSELNIGTAKPDEAELAAVKHHFINSHSIQDSYNAGAYERDVLQLLEKRFAKHRILVVVGGSTLYLKGLWEGFDDMPEIKEGIRSQLIAQFKAEGLPPLVSELKEKDPAYFEKADTQNGQRIIRALEVIRSTGRPFSQFRQASQKERPFRNLKIGLDMPRDLLFERINQRADRMIAQNLIEEVQSLTKYRHHNALQTVGYTEIFDYLDGTCDKAEAIRLFKRNSRRYAKRQLTWFKKDEDIHWFDPHQEKEILSLIETHR